MEPDELPREVVQIGGVIHRSGYFSWGVPPLWVVVVPCLTGFLSPMVYYWEWVPRLFDWDLVTPFVVLILASPLLYFAPKPVGRSPELIAGTNVGMFLAFWPQLFFFVWFIVVILYWIFQSMFVWKYKYPAFRIGTWIGLGAVSGLFVGGFVFFI